MRFFFCVLWFSSLCYFAVLLILMKDVWFVLVGGESYLGASCLWFGLVWFGLVWFSFVEYCFVLFCFVSFRFRFVSFFFVCVSSVASPGGYDSDIRTADDEVRKTRLTKAGRRRQAGWQVSRHQAD